jgi:O-antigen ligase
VAVTERFTFNPPSSSTAAGGAPLSAKPPVAAAFRRTIWARPQRTAPSSEPRDWAFIWTLLFTAVLFLRPQDLFPPLEMLHLAEVTALGGLVALLSGRLSRGQPISRLTPELVAVMAFGGIILVTAPFSMWMGGAVQTFTDMYVKVILVYLLAINVISSPKRLERLTWLLVLALGYIAFRAVLDYVRGDNLISKGTRVQGAVGGMLQNPNDLALNLVAFLPLAVLMALRPDAKLLKRLAAMGCAVFMLGGIVASGSRGGSIGLVVMILVLAMSTVRRRPGLVIAGALAVLCTIPILPEAYWRRIASITDSSKDDFGSSDARRRLLGESLDAFKENFVIGVGAGNFKAWNPRGRVEAWHESHNVIMQVASELGLVGLSVFLFLIFRAFFAVAQTRRLLRDARAATRPARPGFTRKIAPGPAIPAADAALLDAHSSAMAAALAGWFACALFASVAYNWTFYYLLALAATPREMLRDRLPQAGTARASRPRVAVEAARA